jgi:uncharacterized protein (DUF1015 family)
MAEIRPFRALRYTSKADPALVIAPPYDVISARQQKELYERSTHNVVRIEYGEQRSGDNDDDNRYTRAAQDLQEWRSGGALALDATPAIYAYTQTFASGGRSHERRAYFVALRLEEWEKGIVKPHEHTLANPKADRLKLLRSARTQISPVYSITRTAGELPAMPAGAPLYDFEADEQRHVLAAIADKDAIESFARAIADAGVYIADGHHRYETALAYRDEVRAAASSWTGDEPENFVLMALTVVDDPGLIVLPTHRMLNPPAWPENALDRLDWHFEVEDIGHADTAYAMGLLAKARKDAPAFIGIGLETSAMHLITLKDRGSVENLMPRDEPDAWKRLDVNILQYGILFDVFGIDDPMLKAGGVVDYTQDARVAANSVSSGAARCAFLLNATPVHQVIAVADAGARMPQKSTYFYPKLPTGLVMRTLDS